MEDDGEPEDIDIADDEIEPIEIIGMTSSE